MQIVLNLSRKQIWLENAVWKKIIELYWMCIGCEYALYVNYGQKLQSVFV